MENTPPETPLPLRELTVNTTTMQPPGPFSAPAPAHYQPSWDGQFAAPSPMTPAPYQGQHLYQVQPTQLTSEQLQQQIERLQHLQQLSQLQQFQMQTHPPTPYMPQPQYQQHHRQYQQQPQHAGLFPPTPTPPRLQGRQPLQQLQQTAPTYHDLRPQAAVYESQGSWSSDSGQGNDIEGIEICRADEDTMPAEDSPAEEETADVQDENRPLAESDVAVVTTVARRSPGRGEQPSTTSSSPR